MLGDDGPTDMTGGARCASARCEDVVNSGVEVAVVGVAGAVESGADVAVPSVAGVVDSALSTRFVTGTAGGVIAVSVVVVNGAEGCVDAERVTVAAGAAPGLDPVLVVPAEEGCWAISVLAAEAFTCNAGAMLRDPGSRPTFSGKASAVAGRGALGVPDAVSTDAVVSSVIGCTSTDASATGEELRPIVTTMLAVCAVIRPIPAPAPVELRVAECVVVLSSCVLSVGV
jgi:hypothetical protein